VDERFEQIFEFLYRGPDADYREQFQYFGPSPRVRYQPISVDSTIMQGMIDAAASSVESSRQLRVRPDARLWLKLNFIDMILVPYILRYPDRAETIIRRIQDDLLTILREAEPSAGELSGHDVLRATSEQWPRLSSANNEEW